jgi:hypothetical protein
MLTYLLLAYYTLYLLIPVKGDSLETEHIKAHAHSVQQKSSAWNFPSSKSEVM